MALFRRQCSRTVVVRSGAPLIRASIVRRISDVVPANQRDVGLPTCLSMHGAYDLWVLDLKPKITLVTSHSNKARVPS